MSDNFNKQLEIIIPILVYIQANLHEELGLEVVAKKSGLSPYYFHRTFKSVVGETLKQYVTRIKLEKAAFALRHWDESVLSLSIELGFKNPETFTRAFKRKFNLLPSEFKRERSEMIDEVERSGKPLQTASNYGISKVTIKQLNSIQVAFIRNIGPYETVDASQFDKLISWAKAKHIYRNDLLLLGIGHDAPHITPKELQRFDCCIEVDEPLSGEGEINFQEIIGGEFATVTYVGEYGEKMQQAYQTLYREILKKKVKFVGLPAIEIYRTTVINPTYSLNQTDIYIPIEEGS